VSLHIVTTVERPDLVPVVADWLWEEFWRDDGLTLDAARRRVEDSTPAAAIPRFFAALAEGVPVGVASLVAQDLEERRDLTPWLATVFVKPETRGLGHAGRLVAAVENECRAASITVLWLYTRTAERIYARIGWKTVDRFRRAGRDYDYALMRRDLSQSP
jgi:GNAT superfamily N-acetyltransferase